MHVGWCIECHPNRDAILGRLLMTPDPHWRLPEWVAAEREVLAGILAETEHLRARSEAARRAHARRWAEMRYRLARERVCLNCEEAQANYSQLCPPCQTAWKEEEAAQIDRTRRPGQRGRRGWRRGLKGDER